MTQLKEVYKVKATHTAFFTGGDVVWPDDGDVMLFQCGATVKVVDIDQGQVISSIDEEVDSKGFDDEIEEDSILTFTLSKDNNILVSAHKSKLFKMWLWKDKKLLKVWQSMHKVPVCKLTISSDCSQLATGATDASIRLWDLNNHACTHNLPVVDMQGVISILFFHENENTKLLFGAADDAVIRCWDVQKGLLHMTYRGHFSKVTGVIICDDNCRMISCSRDKVFFIWDIKTGRSLHTVPVYESLEALSVISDNITLPGHSKPLTKGTFVVVAGEKGTLKIWDATKIKELYVEQESLFSSGQDGFSIIKLLYCAARKRLAVVSSDHTIAILDVDNSLNVDKQLVGFSDDILDIVFIGEKQSHMAVATNSPNIKLYRSSNMDCQLLKGHTDLVISLATTRSNTSLFVSGSKDNSIRVWLLNSAGVVQCVATGCRHTASVSSVAFGCINSNLLVSASLDTTLKLWLLPKKLKHDYVDILNVKHTELAHDKDINGVCVSPNDKIIATASFDKTAKIWNANDLSLIGVLRGHRRGVWSVRFSPVDQVVLTTSADSTLKLWSLSDLSCLKTFEGHDSSVLRAEFLTRGLQIASTGGDGLVKLWCIKTSECVATFDEHDGKIWALSVSQDESELVTGGSDSKLLIWKDVTEETKTEATNKRQEYILQEQELSNLIHNKKLLPALKLALTLDHPATVLKIVNDVQQNKSKGFETAINDLDTAHKEALLKCASVWNTNTKTVQAAQIVISLLLNDLTSGKIHVDKSVMESILVFTERHFKRMTQLQQDLQILLYTSDIMQPRANS
ncbi:transducin beta-like protein 3 [Lycorma delicatula]|uniref:transducin beta-like protein 3 n=1 Tax=Lycorma delicatula TaxID=130591 RepID=UPI003F513EE0